MITVLNNNVHIYRTEGTSDEQASVLKEIFSDQSFSHKHHLCSINSINWGRILCQSTYYIWAYLQLCGKTSECGIKEVSFCIPTGAFGNALGAFIARQMGFPILKILCATNANDIVYRTLSSGDMSMGTNIQTISPASKLYLHHPNQSSPLHFTHSMTSPLNISPLNIALTIYYLLPYQVWTVSDLTDTVIPFRLVVSYSLLFFPLALFSSGYSICLQFRTMYLLLMWRRPLSRA